MTAKQSKTTALTFNLTTVKLKSMPQKINLTMKLSKFLFKNEHIARSDDLSLSKYFIKHLVLTQDISIVYELIINI